ncbi:hypothetical protein [Dankookia rubra]|uniref:hypothetical protein n=1 Tax=Dankookia rubra TaxID=1442381 RepID=UPI00351A36C8
MAVSRTLSRPDRTFVAELRKDITAVEAALSLPWTTSPAEGQICRIKMIKRTMYGRAGDQPPSSGPGGILVDHRRRACS